LLEEFVPDIMPVIRRAVRKGRALRDIEARFDKGHHKVVENPGNKVAGQSQPNPAFLHRHAMRPFLGARMSPGAL